MILLFLANGFEEVEALAPLDLLRRAGNQVRTVGIGGKRVIGAHGIMVEADLDEAEIPEESPEMVILPGGMPGARTRQTCRAPSRRRQGPWRGRRRRRA